MGIEQHTFKKKKKRKTHPNNFSLQIFYQNILEILKFKQKIIIKLLSHIFLKCKYITIL